MDVILFYAPDDDAESTVVPQEGPEADEGTELPPEQQKAFARSWAARKARMEDQIRQQVMAEMAAKEELPPPPEYSDDPEELAKINAELVNSFYDDPLGSIKKAHEYMTQLEQKKAQAEQAKWDYEAMKLAKRYSDWADMVPKMQALLKEAPDLAERPEQLDRVYKLAKRLNNDVKGPDPDALLNDPTFLEKAKGKVKDGIINEYVNGKVKAPPPVMGGSPGGVAPAMPATTPKTFAEAKRAALARRPEP